MAKISIDSSVLEDVVSRLSSDNNSLSKMKDSLDRDFVCMINAGLFEEQMKKLKEKVDSISSVYSSISSEISNHLGEYETNENTISEVANDYMSYYDYSGKTRGSKKTKKHVDDSDKTDADSKKVNLEDEIKEIDSKTLISLVNFIDSNKKDDVSINDLMMDESNHDYLISLIKKFYKEQGIDNISVSDNTEIVRTLLINILNSKLNMPQDMNSNSLIAYKEYLNSIASKYNTDSFTLITNANYQNTIYTYLTNLYNGSTSDINVGYSTELIAGFKAMVDSKSNIYNTSVDELLKNPLFLV